MDLTWQEQSAVDYVKQETGTRLQAIIMSKDRKNLFVIVKARDPEEASFWERRQTNFGPFETVEYHSVATADNALWTSGGWKYKYSESEILYANDEWKAKLDEYL